jgi:hypothetical protein
LLVFLAIFSSLFSYVAAAALLVTTAASAAPSRDHDRDLRRLSPRERARVEQAPRARERQQAIERAHWEAQRRHDRGPARAYSHR